MTINTPRIRGHVTVRFSVTLSLLALFVSCATEDKVSFPIDLSGQPGTLQIHSTELEGLASTVFASVKFDNESSGHHAINLTCLALKTGAVVSDRIYVDSVAHILPENYALQRSQISIEVYWIVESTGIERNATETFSLIVKDGCQLFT